MDIDLFQATALSEFHQCIQMGIVAVHTAVGQQPNQMQSGFFRNGIVHRRNKSGIFKEIAILNGLGDAGQLLINNAAGANVGVSDFGVPHLSIRQADVHSGCSDLCNRIAAKDTVQIRLIGCFDCVAVIASNTKAVQNH